MKTIADMFSLAGHTALVTGSSRGIGRGIAMAFGLAGARVVFHGSRPSEKLEQTVAEAQAAGIECEIRTADITRTEDVRRLASECAPDILVLNASAQEYMDIEHFDEDVFEREFTANVKAGYLLIQAFLPAMQANGWGRVISVGSVNQWKQAPRLTVYSATKCAQNAMMQSLARSHADHGVTFNNIAPGVFLTDRNTEAMKKPELVAMLLNQIPARRFGEPDEMAGLALLLASDAGAYINGADIPVTGGMHL